MAKKKKKTENKMNCFSLFAYATLYSTPEDLCESAEEMVLEGVWGIAANALNTSIGVTENIPIVGMFTKKSIPYLKRIVANLSVDSSGKD